MTPLDLCLSGALVLAFVWGLGERWARHDVAADRDEWKKLAVWVVEAEVKAVNERRAAQ